MRAFVLEREEAVQSNSAFRPVGIVLADTGTEAGRIVAEQRGIHVRSWPYLRKGNDPYAYRLVEVPMLNPDAAKVMPTPTA